MRALDPRSTGALLLLAGVAVGFVGRGLLGSSARTPPPGLRAGTFRHVNPLLDCEVDGGAVDDPELRPFKEKLTAFVDAQRRDGGPVLGVYFRELNDGLAFTAGETSGFTPASLRKVPMMIALLKMAERHPEANLLDQRVPFELATDRDALQNIKPSVRLVKGSSYTVLELIQRMIIYSDNNAFMLLGRVVDPAELDAVYETVGARDRAGTGTDPFQSVQTYASFFRVLYNSTWLQREPSDWALGLLARSEFRSGLVAGVPPSVEVAHKFGEHSSREGVQLHDCGIVYYPRHPYLLCVMSKGSGFAPLDEAIAGLSKNVYEAVDAEHARH